MEKPEEKFETDKVADQGKIQAAPALTDLASLKFLDSCAFSTDDFLRDVWAE
jgi:hypothetical protein